MWVAMYSYTKRPSPDFRDGPLYGVRMICIEVSGIDLLQG
jgi:hypothetical protein